MITSSSTEQKNKMACSWRDLPPKEWLYPWPKLHVPLTDESEQLAEECLQKGEEKFMANNFYGALWCFKHLLLLRTAEQPIEGRIFQKMAVCCYYLGQDDYQCQKTETSCELSWYTFGTEFADKALGCSLDNKTMSETFLIRARTALTVLQASSYKNPVAVKCIVEDFLRSYRLTYNNQTLADAVITSYNFGIMLEIISNECSSLSKAAIIELLKKVMKDKMKYKILKFLFMKSWAKIEFRCSASDITLRQVLPDDFDESDSEYRERILTFFDSIETDDVMFIIKRYKKEALHYFAKVLKHSQKIDTQVLCDEACKAEKYEFAMHIIETHHTLPIDCNGLLQWLLDNEEKEKMRDIADKFCQHHYKSINFAKLLQMKTEIDFDLMKKFIKDDTNINEAMLAIIEANDWKSENVKILCLLISKGADCAMLIKHGPWNRNGVTILHVATHISLSIGDTTVLDAVIKSCERSTLYNEASARKIGETPLHVAAKYSQDKEVRYQVLSCLLNSGLVDQSVKDKKKKKAYEYIPIEERASSSLFSVEPKQKKKKKKLNRNKTVTSSTGSKEVEEAANQESNVDREHDPEYGDRTEGQINSVLGTSVAEEETENSSAEPEAIESRADGCSLQEGNIVSSESGNEDEIQIESENKKDEVELESGNEDEVKIKNENEDEAKAEDEVTITTDTNNNNSVRILDELDAVSSMSPDELQKLIQHHIKIIEEKPEKNFYPRMKDCHSSTLRKKSAKTNFSLTSEAPMKHPAIHLFEKLRFDNLPWEVEITKQVLKYFKNKKMASTHGAVAEVIHTIAEGRRGPRLSEVAKKTEHCHLYKAHVPRGGYILWETPIAYSSRATRTYGCEAYSQVIRVWEVLVNLKEDQVLEKIKNCSDRIEKSYQNGEKSPECLSLREKRKADRTPKYDAKISLPQTYEVDHTKDSKFCFVPLVTTNKMEYEVNTFYSFDAKNARSIVTSINDERDYPFKEWHAENEIIQLQSAEAVLLLGRSGTGKTTCCLYRLWNEFKNYWIPDEAHPDKANPKLIRKCLINSRDLAAIETAGENNEAAPGPNALLTEDISYALSSCSEIIEENLHQIFVTKNSLLCSRMKKIFYKMAAAHDFLEEHLEYESAVMPDALGEFKDHNFPAFLSARQFYLLLDSSLEDRKSFFKRPREQVKIVSYDYDDESEDIFEHFDDKIVEDLPNTTDQSDSMSTDGNVVIWTEVTALYFKDNIWPKIKDKCRHKVTVDPMLVWLEIQSFIKGSERAVIKGSPLELTEYEEVGKHMAPNFSSQRKLIYEYYNLYKSYMQNNRHCKLFDEGDLIMNLYQRRQGIKDVSWSIHSVYIDEVQDFTQAELALLTQCCRNPNSMFFTGDTAQSIMRGIAFRFQDLRSIYHRLNDQVPDIKVPSKPYCLTLNYRSHSSILKLSGTVIDLIEEFFQNSIDHLPRDKGLLPGSLPVFLKCSEDELSQVLNPDAQTNPPEFGAHQAIIVQSKEAKNRLPDSLKRNIILTVLEAKGLEFNDVLLYNFFSDSIVNKKTWRVVASYLLKHKSLVKNDVPLPGISIRSIEFDESCHKSLNSELKHLYTAITRAKCNLWIYDSNKDLKAESMLDYWHKRNTVKITTVNAVKKDMFIPNISSVTDWKEQGDALRKRHIWSEACFCYAKAGLIHLVKETQYQAIMTAIRRGEDLSCPHLRAGLLLLQMNENRPNERYTLITAQLLTQSKTPMYFEAAKLFEMQGKLNKAVECYKSAGDFENFARIHERNENYDAVITGLQQKPFENYPKALQMYLEYERTNRKTSFTRDTLVEKCADYYVRTKNEKALLEVLDQHVNCFIKIIEYLKEAKMYEEVYKRYMAKKMYFEAVQLTIAQGWVDKSYTEKYSKITEASNYYRLVFLRAKMFLIAPNDLLLKNSLISELEQYTDNGNISHTALSLLLIGKINKDTNIKKALNVFKERENTAFQLEAFNLMKVLDDKVDEKMVIKYCQKAEDLINALRVHRAKSHQSTLNETLWVYDIEFTNGQYTMSRHGQLWLQFNEHQKFDMDGMMCFSKESMIDGLCERFYMLSQNWITDYKVDSILQFEYEKYAENFEQNTPAGYDSLGIERYLQICLYMRGRDGVDENTLYLAIPLLFTFGVSTTLNCDCFEKIESNYLISHNIRKIIIAEAKVMISTHSENFNEWFKIWKLDGLCGRRLMRTKEEPKYHSFPQIFKIWVDSCKQNKVLLASRSVIEQFLPNVIIRELISIQNVVDILTVQFMSLFELISRSQYYNSEGDIVTPFYFPRAYKWGKKLFNKFNRRTYSTDINYDQNLTEEAIGLLKKTLDLLCNNSLTQFLTISPTIASQQWLVLTLTLFANLEVYRQNMMEYHEKIKFILNKEENNWDNVFIMLQNPNVQVSDIFQSIVDLQVSSFGEENRLIKKYYGPKSFHEEKVTAPGDIQILSDLLLKKSTPSESVSEIVNVSLSSVNGGISSQVTPSYSKVVTSGSQEGKSTLFSLEDFPSIQEPLGIVCDTSTTVANSEQFQENTPTSVSSSNVWSRRPNLNPHSGQS